MGVAVRLSWVWSAFALLGCGGPEPAEAGTETSGPATTGGSETGGAPGTTGSRGGASEDGSTLPVSESTGSAGGSTSNTEGEGSTGRLPRSDCDRLDAFVERLARTEPENVDPEIDSFVREAQYGEHGLPLRCDDRVVFLAVTTESLSVAGDFNDWTPAPMERPVEGAPFLLSEATVEAPGGLYKFVDGEVFIADPLARRYGWDQFGEFSIVDGDAERSHHERWPAFSDSVDPLQPRTVRVYVPAAVNAGEDAEVLLMHDGQNLFDPDAIFGGWQASQTADSMILQREIDPVLLVGIDNTSARFEEYTHVVDDIGGGPVGGQADDYADFVVDGVLPFIGARYPTRMGPEHTAVLGSSLGGLVSLHLAHRHPDVFGSVGSMSGTLGWGTFGLDNETMIDRYADIAPPGLRVYVDSGGAGPCPGGSGDNYCENVAFADVMRSQGWVDEEALFYRWTPDAPHNEAAWAARFGIALRVLSVGP